MLQEGIAEWDANTPYYKGGLVKTISGTSFKLYCSLADNNTNKAVTNTSYWKKVMDSDDLYAYDSAVVHLAGTETITGAKTFTNSVNRQGSWTAGTPSSGNQTSYINFTDSTGTSYGSIGKFYGAGGTFVTEMTGKKTDGTGEIKIAIGYDASGNPIATAPTPDTATNTTSTQIATTGWVNTVGNNVMHLTGNESASGDKTFTGKIIRKGSFTIGTLPSSTSQANIEFDDNANTVAGSVNTQYTTGGSLETRLRVRKIGTSGFDGITVGSDSGGNIYTYAPTPNTTTQTTSTQIATTGWVNSVGNNVMHLTGNESVGGNKTFTNQLALNAGLKFNNSTQGYITATAQNSAINIGTAPSTNTGYQVNLEDATGGLNHRVGGFVTIYKTNGSIETQIRAYKPDGSTQTQAEVAVIYPASGSPWATAPESSVAGSILTTNAINKAQNGYLKLGNGVIIQWGRKEVTASGGQTITLPTAFTNSNYKVVSENEASDGYGQLGITERKTTNFTFNPNWAGTYAWIAIGCDPMDRSTPGLPAHHQ